MVLHDDLQHPKFCKYLLGKLQPTQISIQSNLIHLPVHGATYLLKMSLVEDYPPSTLPTVYSKFDHQMEALFTNINSDPPLPPRGFKKGFFCNFLEHLKDLQNLRWERVFATKMPYLMFLRQKLLILRFYGYFV